jgi:hypothetical protein
VLEGAATTLALGVLGDGRILWYGEGGCASRPCADATPSCTQTICDPPTAWIVDEAGNATPWPDLPSGLVAIELDATGQWMATIEADGRIGVRSVEDPASVIAVPHTAMHGEYERPTVAVGSGGRDVAVADATGVHAWSRTDDGRVHARLTSGELDTTAMSWSRDGTILLVAGTSALVGYKVKAPTSGSPPSLAIPLPDGWERAPEVDGVPTWTDDGRGEPWPAPPGVVTWLRHGDGAEITVHLSDRAEFGRDELAADAWARLVLSRIDPWVEPTTELELAHEDAAWRDDEGRGLQLHYTTVGGCEQYEVVHRVVERGAWLWHVQLRQFAGEPWRDAWRTATSTLPPVPQDATKIW